MITLADLKLPRPVNLYGPGGYVGTVSLKQFCQWMGFYDSDDTYVIHVGNLGAWMLYATLVDGER